MKTKLLKKIRKNKQYKFINPDKTLVVIDNKKQEVNYYRNITDFMKDIISEYFGINTLLKYWSRKIKRTKKTIYLNEKKYFNQ